MKKLNLTFTLLIFTIFSLFADEGMWLLTDIKSYYPRMKALGCNLSVKEIYNLKDVVITLDGGSCTGEIISPNGLILTNHHCAYDEIQEHSSVENDYLKNGFWATSFEEELPNPGKEAWFLIEIKDVTKQVLKGIEPNFPDSIKESFIKINIENIKQKFKDDKYFYEVKSFYDGNQYLLLKYLIYKDVRLVGAPPENIGKYGGDTDNWMWPRHTGDFALLRIYAKPDGSPAEYSPDNVPLKTPKYLKLSLKGYKENDFAMIMGYPGSTKRYLTSWEVEEIRDFENAIRIKVRDKKLSILKSYMDKDEKIRIQYAANYAQSANYYKYSKGQNLGFERLKVIQKKVELQKKINNWINKRRNRKKLYGQTLDNIKNTVLQRKEQINAQNYWFEVIYLGSSVFELGYEILSALNATHDISELRKKAEKYFKDFNKIVEKDLFINLLNLYLDNVPKKYWPSIIGDYATVEDLADDIFDNSILADSTKFFNAIDNLSFYLYADVGMKYVISALKAYFKISDDLKLIENQNNYSTARKNFVKVSMKVLKKYNKDTIFYPDANSTMRLTYGKVLGYKWEGKKYNYFTTIEGYVKKGEKYKDNPEFEMNKKMVELYKAKNFGPYADKDGTLHLCFLTDNDITGGNSGSPVLNKDGELIGVAFDGNWEAMSGDIIFEEPVQRTICVDIRYVLFVIDKVANAQHILKELTIVK